MAEILIDDEEMKRLEWEYNSAKSLDTLVSSWIGIIRFALDFLFQQIPVKVNYQNHIINRSYYWVLVW